MNDRFALARNIVTAGTRTAYPAAVVEVGRHDDVLWEEAFGRLAPEPGAPATRLDTVFDLASLTKVLSTTILAMRAVDDGRVELDRPLLHHLTHWRGTDRDAVTVADLLAHASGLTAHLPFYRDHAGRAEFERAICTLPLEYRPRTRSIYSDLGFMLLGFILEDALQRSVEETFRELTRHRGWGDITFRPGPALRARAAPTEVDPWRGRRLVGEVHDENAWALGGVAGHAGLFGTAGAVGRIAREVLGGLVGDGALATPETVRAFATRTTIPDSTRALGWDTMKPTSSCGTRMSPGAIGHTGFTGTSLWIDPVADVYVVFLTNRVYLTRENDALLQVRPRLHDAVMAALARPPRS